MSSVHSPQPSSTPSASAAPIAHAEQPPPAEPSSAVSTGQSSAVSTRPSPGVSMGPSAAVFIGQSTAISTEPSAPGAVLEATSVRHPHVQAQYQHDVSAEKSVFPDRRPCPMGKMIRIARESGLTDPREPILGDNIYPYAHFADQRVLRHQLLTPSYHVADVDDLLEIDREAWERFYLRQGELRRAGHAIFIHGLGSSAMSVAAHVHAHVFTLGEKIRVFDYDQEAQRVRIKTGDCWLIDTEQPSEPFAPAPWEPESSTCDHVHQERFGWA